ncbi:MAG: hypothetical protein JWP91_1422 [Fibrobacteres bacterium]|nr:hypothetical protein [Fibrobacterota bacterium]
MRSFSADALRSAFATAALALGGMAAMSFPAVVPARAAISFEISPYSVKALSTKDPRWDTVVVQTYVYVSGDETYRNTGKTRMLYLDLRIDSLSVAKHYLEPGDSLEAINGFMIKDTLTVLKTPFAAVTWSDPQYVFEKETTVGNMRVSSQFVDLHPRIDTVKVAGCPLPTAIGPGARGRSVRAALSAAAPIPTTIYNLIGKPVWAGQSVPGRIPETALSEGIYLMSQTSGNRIFRILPR